MDLFLRFAYWPLLLITLSLLFLALIYRYRWYRSVRYRYSLVSTLVAHGVKKTSWRKNVLLFLRLAILFSLAFFVGRPQLVDRRTKLPVEGIDIMMVLDVSGSMNCFDDLSDRRSRIDVAKSEAQRFIKARENDAIGLVLFGNDVISRLPLTTDKKLLEQLVHEIELGMIDPQGTLLAAGLSLGIHRLEHSTAKSKIVILLTDGQPSSNDVDPRIAIDLAKKVGIKVYVIGIGNEEGGYFYHPIFGVQQQAEVGLNQKLLKAMADETGGKFFEARNPEELKKIYDAINILEKREHDLDIYYNYDDLFLSLFWLVICFIVSELILSLWWLRL